jgi:hypothetical protein
MHPGKAFISNCSVISILKLIEKFHQRTLKVIYHGDKYFIKIESLSTINSISNNAVSYISHFLNILF